MRRLLTVLFICFGFGASALAQETTSTNANGERVLGDPDAPVTITEMSSLTCPHCARFHAGTFQELKEKYVDTGKVKIVYTDFPLDQPGYLASVVARCVPEERYFKFIDVLFKSQGSWSRAADPLAALAKIAKLGGVSEDNLQACLEDKSIGDNILKRRLEVSKTYQVQSTPTFVVNGKDKIEGNQPLSEFEAVIESYLEQ